MSLYILLGCGYLTSHIVSNSWGQALGESGVDENGWSAPKPTELASEPILRGNIAGWRSYESELKLTLYEFSALPCVDKHLLHFSDLSEVRNDLLDSRLRVHQIRVVAVGPRVYTSITTYCISRRLVQ